MSALFATVVVASLAGSLHCLAMCGPLVGLAAGRHSLRFAMLHAFGRLATYVALGAGAGAVGRALDFAGNLGAVQHVAAILAAVVIVGWGAYTIAAAYGIVGTGTSASRGTTLFARSLVQIRSRRAASRAYLTGVLTGLLPCGWLWAFVVSAAGTGSALTGAAVMAMFWLGTVPAMTGALALIGPLVDRLRARMPVVTSVALVILGLGTLALRWENVGARGIETPSCHHKAGLR